MFEKKLRIIISPGVHVELKFLEINLQYFRMHPVSIFGIYYTVLFTVFLILCSNYFRYIL
jgi:hypothetical protein